MAAVVGSTARLCDHQGPICPVGAGANLGWLHRVEHDGAGGPLPEDPKAYKITAELPGIEEKENFSRSERSYGGFQRSFSLSGGTDASNITAGFAKGVPNVIVPKTKQGKSEPTRIEVKAALEPHPGSSGAARWHRRTRTDGRCHCGWLLARHRLSSRARAGASRAPSMTSRGPSAEARSTSSPMFREGMSMAAAV